MGFINNTEIYIEAVLTDYGRKLLAEGNGAFNITKFAVADDDIDYSLWKPASINPDDDLINLPIMEPLTNEEFAINSRLVTINNQNLRYMPVIDCVDSILLNSIANSTTGYIVSAGVKMANNDKISPELVDNLYKVIVDNNFLTVLTEDSDVIQPNNVSIYNLASYIVDADKTANAFGGKGVKFQLLVKNISDDIWSQYGILKNDYMHIYTFCRIEGLNSGLNKTINISIQKSG